MRAIVTALAVLSAFPAWGQAQYEAPPTGQEIGRIVITNQVQPKVYSRNEYAFDHEGKPVEVTVHYTSTPNYGGEDPRDIIQVTVPEGYVAIPSEARVPENEVIEVAIYEAIIG